MADADGIWNKTDELPPDAEGFVVSLGEPINPLPPPRSSTPKAIQAKTERLVTVAEAPSGGLTVSSDQMHEVIYTIRGLQEGLENREQRIRQPAQER